MSVGNCDKCSLYSCNLRLVESDLLCMGCSSSADPIKEARCRAREEMTAMTPPLSDTELAAAYELARRFLAGTNYARGEEPSDIFLARAVLTLRERLAAAERNRDEALEQERITRESPPWLTDMNVAILRAERDEARAKLAEAQKRIFNLESILYDDLDYRGDR